MLTQNTIMLVITKVNAPCKAIVMSTENPDAYWEVLHHITTGKQIYVNKSVTG